MDAGGQGEAQLTGYGPLGLGLPNNPQSIRRDPLVLFTNQALFTTNGKEVIKPLTGLGELAGFQIQYGFEFPLALHPFLISHSQTKRTHSGHHDQAELEGETEHTANQLLAVRGKAQKLTIGTKYSLSWGPACLLGLGWGPALSSRQGLRLGGSPGNGSPGGLGHADKRRDLARLLADISGHAKG